MRLAQNDERIDVQPRWFFQDYWKKRLDSQIAGLPSDLRVGTQIVSESELGMRDPCRGREYQDRLMTWCVATDPIAMRMGARRGLIKLLESKSWPLYSGEEQARGSRRGKK